MHRIRAVACNDYVTLCLLENATVLSIGGSHDYEPKPLPALAGLQVIQIDCGEKHCAAVDQNGDLYTWGGMSAQYNKGQLGHGNNKGVEQPARVKTLENHRVMRVACGGYHTIVLTAENLLFGFGSNQSGECGIGEPKDINRPMPIEIPTRRKTNPLISDLLPEHDTVPLEDLAKPNIKTIACGGKHSLVLTTDGDLYTFGYGQQGQLGHRTSKNVFKPRFV